MTRKPEIAGTKLHRPQASLAPAGATPVVVFVAVVSLAAAGWAALRAAAAWQFFAAQTIMERMFEASSYTPNGLAAARQRIDKALVRFPGRSDFLDLAGQISELRASQPGVVGQAHRALLEGAAGNYRRALTARPLWPYSWANLLSAKDKLGEVDGEFVTALQRAAATGPWEPRVQLQLIRSGLRHWERLAGAERARVRETMDQALRVQPREAFELASFYVRPDLVCGSGRQPIERWCEQVWQETGHAGTE